ncbi:MAG: class I SAM-dependent methyltransferase [Clostridiaceae bacterium]|jgi:ubiquinone/menaquinone biosynthesis C-methylase UbiE|nr:class I SAM-dependent methyltransferase [Clostridiaceae bacterium]
MGKFSWQYDEIQQAGVDYTKLSEVEAYDERMAKLRDVKQETVNIIKLLDVGSGHTVIEFGTGTGEFACAAAQCCKRVIAVDVSANMLEYAKKKSKEKGIHNIDFYHGGFLTYQHSDGLADIVITQLALHHLPDFWKQIALKRIFNMLKEGGTLYIKDTVYSFDMDNYRQFFNQWISGTLVSAGEELAQDIEIAVRKEFSTCDWIMEGLLRHAGFTIHKAEYSQGFLAQYICMKNQADIPGLE